MNNSWAAIGFALLFIGSVIATGSVVTLWITPPSYVDLPTEQMTFLIGFGMMLFGSQIAIIGIMSKPKHR